MDVVSCGKNWNKIRKSVTAGFFTHAAKKDPQVSKSAQCSARRRIAALRCVKLAGTCCACGGNALQHIVRA